MAVVSSSFQPSRIGFGSILGAPRPAGWISKWRCGAPAPTCADAAEDGAAGDLGAHPQIAQLHRLGVELEGAGEVALEGLVAGDLLAEQAVELARDAGGVDVGGPLGQGEQALAQLLGVDGGRRLGVARLRVGLRVVRAGARRAPGPGVGAVAIGVGVADDLEVLGAQRPLLRDGVDLGDLAELRVRVSVAVRVLEDDELAELLALAHLGDDAVVDRDDRSINPRVDVDASARGAVGDDVGGVAGLRPCGLRALHCLAQRDVVGVARVGGDGEVGALGQARQRADQVVGELRVLVGVQQDLVHVPVSVVVGEDRVAQVLLGAGGLQVAAGGADRVDGVVGVLAPVLVGVDPVGPPARGDELHPAQGARRGDVEVGAERGLDPVDRGQHLPRHPVLGAAGLVDRQQERRDLELVDDEVGDADRGRAELGDREARVGVRRRAVGVADRLLLELVALGLALNRSALGGLDAEDAGRRGALLLGAALLLGGAGAELAAAAVAAARAAAAAAGSGGRGWVVLVDVERAGAAGVGEVRPAVPVVVGEVRARGKGAAGGHLHLRAAAEVHRRRPGCPGRDHSHG